jgi:hypothetical protein
MRRIEEKLKRTSNIKVKKREVHVRCSMLDVRCSMFVLIILISFARPVLMRLGRDATTTTSELRDQSDKAY